MGTIGETGRLASFNNDIFPLGVDLDRSKYHQDGGVYRIVDNAIIRPGSLVTRTGADGLVSQVSSAAEASNVFGVAKWGTEPLGLSVVVDEEVVVGSGTVSQLNHPNVSNLVVRDVPLDGGLTAATEIPAAANYTLGAANGTLTWAAPPAGTNAPAIGDTVYVTYTWAMTLADFRFQGVKFHSNSSNDLLNSSENRLTVITDWAIIFTTEWDTSFTYDTAGELSDLYCDATGRFSNLGGFAGATALFGAGNEGRGYVGKVFQLPDANDAFLGVQIGASPRLHGA
jgi:hypothetical protein